MPGGSLDAGDPAHPDRLLRLVGPTGPAVGSDVGPEVGPAVHSTADPAADRPYFTPSRDPRSTLSGASSRWICWDAWRT